MSGGLSGYQIWVKEGGGPWYIDAVVGPATLSYSKPFTNPGALYEFVVRAVSQDGRTAASNLIVMTADIFSPPQFLYIRYASVNGSSVNIKCYADPSADTKSYRLYRAESQGGSFRLIQTINITGSSEIDFYDAFAEADLGQRSYKVTAVDSCGNESSSENIAATIHLTAEGGSDYISRLKWTSYEGWLNPVDGYKILRVVSGSVSGFEAGIASGNSNDFNEDVSELSFDNDNFCYVLKAFEFGNNSYGFSDTAFSNVACAPHEPLIFVPNAFAPEGVNRVFLPVIRYADPESYTFRIFNRYGQEIFMSNNKNLGWSGVMNGSPLPSGIYAYLISFKGLNNKEIVKNGTVFLVR
jgi:gliding motility-associated-like protein